MKDLDYTNRVIRLLRQTKTLVNEKYSVGGRLKQRTAISLPKIKELTDANQTTQRREPK
jgi:hypothetical protein